MRAITLALLKAASSRPNCAARTRDADRSVYRLFRANAFKNGMRAVTAGERTHSLNGFVATLAHNIGCAEFLSERAAIRMAT
jgi:hypothetical protein